MRCPKCGDKLQCVLCGEYIEIPEVKFNERINQPQTGGYMLPKQNDPKWSPSKYDNGERPRLRSELNTMLDLPISFGLIQQGKLGYVGKMLAEGKSWRWIAATINWEAKTLREHWLNIMGQI